MRHKTPSNLSQKNPLVKFLEFFGKWGLLALAASLAVACAGILLHINQLIYGGIISASVFMFFIALWMLYQEASDDRF